MCKPQTKEPNKTNMKRKLLKLLCAAFLFLAPYFTAEAQILIKDINPGPDRSSISVGEIVGNKLFFIARNPNPGLWVSDRKTGSTHMIGPVLPGIAGTPNDQSKFLVFRDSLLVFTAYHNGIDVNLYSTTGSIEGTQFIKTLTRGASIYDGFVGFNNKFYFKGYDAIHRTELWESDGSASGTQHLLNSFTGNPAISLPSASDGRSPA